MMKIIRQSGFKLLPRDLSGNFLPLSWKMLETTVYKTDLSTETRLDAEASAPEFSGEFQVEIRVRGSWMFLPINLFSNNYAEG